MLMGGVWDPGKRGEGERASGSNTRTNGTQSWQQQQPHNMTTEHTSSGAPGLYRVGTRVRVRTTPPRHLMLVDRTGGRRRDDIVRGVVHVLLVKGSRERILRRHGRVDGGHRPKRVAGMCHPLFLWL